MKKILVTGGAGYIGSHTCVELIQSKLFTPIVYDNLSNSSSISLNRVKQITGKSVTLIEGDVRDEAKLNEVFNQYNIDAVIHFAGLKAVGESVDKPLLYYDNNISGSIILLNVMKKYAVKRIVFSSSATVYGDPESVPIQEHFPLSATNAYGRSKLFIEAILKDTYRSDNHWNIALLRYFNPVGAHRSGLIGENPTGVPNNIMPYISRVALGQYPELSVFGGDYSTPDGTGVRDYIHVVDLARGHVKALQYFDQTDHNNLLTVNLGAGKGYSVLELVAAFEKASGNQIAYTIVDRRDGDIACCYADPSLAEKLLAWKAVHSIDEMCMDTWRWQQNNPQGF